MKVVSHAPPPTVADLDRRAGSLDGASLGEIAAALGQTPPDDLRAAKGWAGRLIETALGAPGAGPGEPDFPELGVEVKTVPVDPRGRPRESTWVCRVPEHPERRWEDAVVRRKLAAVLWVPIEAFGPIAGRAVVRPRLWRPTPEQEAVLRADWETLTERMLLGPPPDARVGVALQLRPKAAGRADLSWTLDVDGEWVRDVARGYYLRRAFTAAILPSDPPPRP